MHTPPTCVGHTSSHSLPVATPSPHAGERAVRPACGLSAFLQCLRRSSLPVRISTRHTGGVPVLLPFTLSGPRGLLVVCCLLPCSAESPCCRHVQVAKKSTFGKTRRNRCCDCSDTQFFVCTISIHGKISWKSGSSCPTCTSESPIRDRSGTDPGQIQLYGTFKHGQTQEEK